MKKVGCALKKFYEKLKKPFEVVKADNRGIGVVEILLILVVLIGLVIIFRTQIQNIVRSAFDSVNSNVEVIVGS